MKAYQRDQYGGPEVLKIEELQTPKPEAKEVLVKVMAASVNAADWRVLRADPWLVRPTMGLFKPKTKFLGADIAGIIEEVGTEVTQWSKGDRVVSDILGSKTGAFSEYVVVSEDLLAKIPESVSYEQAAGTPIAGLTALQSLRDWAHTQKGDKVLINGASGGVGTFAVQIAKAIGAHVTAVCSGPNMDMVKSIGADEAIDYQQEDFRKKSEKYDVIYDVVGNISASDCHRLLNENGSALLIGFSGMSHMLRWMMQGKWFQRSTGKQFITKSAKMNAADLQYLQNLLEEGKVKTVVDQVYPFDQLPNAITYSETGRVKGKLILKVGE